MAEITNPAFRRLGREHGAGRYVRGDTDSPRGRQGCPGRVSLPDGWLDDPDDPSVPGGAELADCGG